MLLLPPLVVAGLLVAVLLTGAAVPAAMLALGRTAEQAPVSLPSAPTPSEAAASADSPTGGPSVTPSPSVAPVDPYAGTPAATYPPGPDGIVLRPAAPLGPWSEEDVQEVLTGTREALVAGRLSPEVVVEGDPEPYLEKLAPSTRPLVGEEIAKGEPAIGYVTRLAPGYSLGTAPIRTRGMVGVALGPAEQLVVTADVIWVYPLVGPKAGTVTGPGSTLVVLRTSETYEWYDPAPLAADDRGLRPGEATTWSMNMDCEQVRKGLIALPVRYKGGELTDSVFNPATPPASLPNTC